MSEPISPNPIESDDSAGVSGAPDGGSEPVSIDAKTKAEIAKAARRRDDALKEAKKEKERADALEARLAELSAKESQLEELQRMQSEKEAAEQKNVEKLTKALEDSRAAHKKQYEELKALSDKAIGEERTKRETLEQKLFRSFVEKGLMEELSLHSTNAAAMKVQLQAVYQFEPIEDDDGHYVGVRAKDNHKSIQELHDELCDRLSLPFKRNPRQIGTGTPPTKPQSGAPVTGIPADFHTWDKPRKTKWMSENPELALEAASQAGRSLGR